MFITLLIFLISIFVVESKTNPWVIFIGVIGGIIFLIVAIVFFLWISKQNFVCFTFVYFKFCLFQICHNGSNSAKCGNLISFFYFLFQLALLDMYHFYIMFHLKFFFLSFTHVAQGYCKNLYLAIENFSFLCIWLSKRKNLIIFKLS